MSEKTSKIKLYVVQPNETIESICKKMNVNRIDLVRLNPILKVSPPHAGQPLNIISYMRDSNEESFELDCPALIMKHVYLMKQLVFSKIYASNYVYATNKPLHDNNELLVKCIEYHMPLPNDYNFIQLIEEFQNNILDFIDVVNKKDQESLSKYKDATRNLMNSYEQLEIEKKGSQTINNLMKNWQLYAIKMLANKTNEAEDVFAELEKQYTNISKSF